MSNNLVKDWSEFNKLQDLPSLEDLLFVGMSIAISNIQLIITDLPMCKIWFFL